MDSEKEVLRKIVREKLREKDESTTVIYEKVFPPVVDKNN